MKCEVCGKEIKANGNDARIIAERGVCDQCGIELSLEVACEVCQKKYKVSEIGLFLGHYICNDCSVEDLLNKVQVECVVCGKTVKLLDSCEFKGKHACRHCGIEMMRRPAGSQPGKDKKKITERFMKWFGL